MIDMGGLLVASDGDLPGPGLKGFGFDGSDFLLGPLAADELASRGHAVPAPGNDGAYVSVSGDSRAVEIGVDAAGYRILYLYRAGDRWVLGDSFMDVVDAARERGWPLTPEPAFLEWYTLKGVVCQQPASSHTVYREIEILPARALVAMTRRRGGLAAKVTRRAARRFERGPSYEVVMRSHVATWTARFATLLASDLPLEIDVTAGRDSRAALATLLHASRQSGISLGGRVVARSHAHVPLDLEIAGLLAERAGIEVNPEPDPPASAVAGVTAVEEWRRDSLGVYGPVYLTETSRPAVRVSGSGGEVLRRLYAREDVAVIAERQADRLPHPELMPTMASAVRDDLVPLNRGLEARLEPDLVNYRHFRDRFHGGYFPRRQPVLAPMGSRDLRRAAEAVGPRGRERTQIFADIILGLAPELDGVPFDLDKKEFDAEHRQSLLDLSGVGADCVPGEVIGGLTRPPEPAAGDETPAVEVMAARLTDAVAAVEASGLLPAPYLDRARDAAATAARDGHYRPAQSGQPVATVLLAAEMTRDLDSSEKDLRQ